VCGLLADELHLQGWFWTFISAFDLNTAGFAIAGLFVVVWVIAIGYWKLGRVEARWTARPEIQ
jgi:high-affinity nickel-transport protein